MLPAIPGMHRLATAVIVLVLVTFGADSALAERRVALVIAAEAYRELRPLENPINDAVAMQSALESLGFEVFLETNRDLRRMRRAVDDFREDAEGADVALIFFAGHGMEIDGRNMLLPVDAVAGDARAMAESALPLEELTEAVRAVSSVGLIILDACRNDPFGSGAAGGRAVENLFDEMVQASPGLGRMGRAEGVLFAFAAAPGETASDGEGNNSPFTEALVRYLGTDGLEVRSVLTLVQQEVYDRSRGEQLPYVESGLPRMFFAAPTVTELPERERLLMAMADITPDLRTEVERMAAENDMPLAPLYGALLSVAGRQAAEEGLEPARRALAEAAAGYRALKNELSRLAPGDDEVEALRQQAREAVELGTFERARALLEAARERDADSRVALRDNYISRTLSEASTLLQMAATARADLNHDTAIGDYRAALSLYDELGIATLGRDDWLRWMGALRAIEDLYGILGDSTAALEAVRTRHAMAESLYAEHPNDATLRWEVAVSMGTMAKQLATQGARSEAQRISRDAIEAMQAIADDEPDNLLARGNKAVFMMTLVDLRREMLQDDAENAETDRMEKETIRLIEELAAHPDASPGQRANLPGALLRLAKLRRFAGDKAGENDAMARGLAAARAYLHEKPEDGRAMRIFSALAMERAHQLGRDGSLEDRIAELDLLLEALETLVALHERDKRDAHTLHSLWNVNLTLGDMYRRRHDLDPALAAFDRAADVIRELSRLDPANVALLSERAETHERIASVHRLKGDRESEQESLFIAASMWRDAGVDGTDDDPALRNHRHVLRLLQFRARNWTDEDFVDDAHLALTIVDRFCQVTMQRQGVDFVCGLGQAQGWSLLGTRLAERGERLLSAFAWQRASNHYRRLVEIQPTIEWREELSFALEALGDRRLEGGDWQGALSAYEEQHALAVILAGFVPDNPIRKRNLALSLARLGHALRDGGETTKAETAYRDGIALFSELAAIAPDDPEPRQNMAFLYERIGDLRRMHDDAEGARAAYAETLALRNALLADTPDDPIEQRNLWVAHYLSALVDETPRYHLVEARSILEALEANGQMPADDAIWLTDIRNRLAGMPDDSGH